MTIKMYSNDEKTDMIVIYGECNKNASVLGVYEDPKLIVFFSSSFNQANDVYDTIYETAQLTMFYVF
jgi:hypothetical protein